MEAETGKIEESPGKVQKVVKGGGDIVFPPGREDEGQS